MYCPLFVCLFVYYFVCYIAMQCIRRGLLLPMFRGLCVCVCAFVGHNHESLRYDTRCYFNVHSKAGTSQLNLPHGTDK